MGIDLDQEGRKGHKDYGGTWGRSSWGMEAAMSFLIHLLTMHVERSYH